MGKIILIRKKLYDLVCSKQKADWYDPIKKKKTQYQVCLMNKFASKIQDFPKPVLRCSLSMSFLKPINSL